MIEVVEDAKKRQLEDQKQTEMLQEELEAARNENQAHLDEKDQYLNLMAVVAI